VLSYFLRDRNEHDARSHRYYWWDGEALRPVAGPRALAAMLDAEALYVRAADRRTAG